MAGAGLLELKRRIKSVTNTQKITRAMGLVATAKFKKLRERADRTTPYFDKFNEAIKLMAVSDEIKESQFFKGNKSDTDIYIIVTSDSGLCGSYNANVINTALEHMKGKKVMLITVGERGRGFFKAHRYDTISEFVELGDTPSYKDAEMVMRPAIDAFINGDARSVNLVYTKFFSQVKQDARVIKVLPVEMETANHKKAIEFEPSMQEVFDYVLPKYLSSTMYNALANALASEYAVRMSAMDGATKNAGEIINKLQLIYNRARQSSITQEITEIVSGAEALND